MAKPNGVRFFNVLMAAGSFAGKSMKAIDAGDKLEPAELDVMEAALIKVAGELRREDPAEWPDLFKLADKIESWILRDGRAAPAGGA